MSDAIVVTGASHGIGRAIRERLSADGATVINLDPAAPEAGAAGEHYAVDPADAAATRDALARICARYTITGLVNNPPPGAPRTLQHTDPADLDATLRGSVEAALACVNAVLPAMRARGGGRIVNVARALVTGPEGHTLDALTRGALVSMTRTWALEFRPFSITVNAIAPGRIAAAAPGAARGDGDALTGQPQDVAQAAAFFLDPRSAFITGQLLFVCGGRTLGVQPA